MRAARTLDKSRPPTVTRRPRTAAALAGFRVATNSSLKSYSIEMTEYWVSNRRPTAVRNGPLAQSSRAEVITNLRGLFGKDTQEKTSTDVNKLIRTVLGLVYIDLRKHSIETQVNLNEQPAPIIGNDVQLQQVILNLVMNAIESMNATESRVLSIKSETTRHNSVCVSIADTGSGMPTSVAFLNQCSRPKPAAWEWVFRSASPLSRATMVVSGCRLMRPEARSFILSCRCTAGTRVNLI
jgi:Histidine kinase-, DNA gyrase B-, and HSP90-like ATPase